MSNLKQKIEDVLDKSIRSRLMLHQGGVQVIDFDEKTAIVTIKFTGLCDGCDFASLTFHSIVEGELMSQIPELKGVIMEGNEDPTDF